jgi:hypothetical protein
VFGRGWSAKAEALRDEMRAKLAQSSKERALLADAISKLEATLATDMARRADTQASTEVAVTGLRDALGGQGADLAQAVQEMARMCALLAEHIDSERAERQALVDAVSVLARHVMESNTLPPRAPRVIGGNVYATPASNNDEPNNNGSDEIVLVDDGDQQTNHWSNLGIGARVRCRFGDGWIGGLEVCELIGDGPTLRYRVRRTVDDYVLPARFQRRELELADDASMPPDSPGRWSRS